MRTNNHRMFYAIVLPVLLFLLGCGAAKQSVPPPIVVPPTAPSIGAPEFQKTFGSIQINQNASLSIRYKSLVIAVDMDIDGVPRIKSAPGGKKSMLKQGHDFVFVSAVSKNYLLEFDNGRNLFITGEAEAPESLREFVYDLRDEGKEIYAGLFFRRAQQNETALAQLVGLMQPENAIVLRSPMIGLSPLHEPTLYKALRDEFYENPLAIVTDAREIPF